MKIKKIEAAKNQLETAIILYFNNYDPISTHTLINAAYDILVGIGKRKNIKPIIKDPNNPLVEPKMRKIYFDKFRDCYNFFKHGEKDPNRIINFNPDVNCYFLFDTCRMYQLITSELTESMKLFVLWFSINNQDSIKEKWFKILIKIFSKLHPPDNKEEFWNKFFTAKILNREQLKIETVKYEFKILNIDIKKLIKDLSKGTLLEN